LDPKLTLGLRGGGPVQYADARGVTLSDATSNPYTPYDQPLGDPGAGQIDLQVRMRTTGYCNGAVCGAIGKPGDPGYGIMRSGYPTARGAVAADRTLFRFGTRINVPGYGPGTVLDTGGAIRGLRLDLWFATRQEAIVWGSRYVDVTVRIPVSP
jgi:3D (Asp-Asp-Asp) domain-containing protein